ncbi:MAG: hypothetical protein J5796_03100, partial [Erysipelotrichaceae bacterium]|nr:hypothetical protein [Erysipelotrichaceae bacterium]
RTKLLKITDTHAIVERDGKTLELEYDCVINASGRISNDPSEFYGIVKDTVYVGDCERVGTLADAMNIA